MDKPIFIIAILFMVLFTTGCNRQNVEDLPQVAFSTDNYVVFSEYYDVSFLSIEGKQYTPTTEEVEKGLNLIRAFLDKQSGIRDFSEYKTQIISYTNNSGEKVIYANYFCSTFGADWTKEFLSVDDGGNCFFNIKVNLQTEEVFDLIVNGEA